MSKTKRAVAAAAAHTGPIAAAGLEFVILAAAACTGGWVGTNAQGVPSDWAGALGGGFGLGLAAGAMQLLEWFKASRRAHSYTPSFPPAERNMEEPEAALPSNPQDLMNLLTEAAQAGAAHEAALYSGKVDPAHSLLYEAKRWVGIDATSALFRLTDGAYVYFEKDESGIHPSHTYSFIVPKTGSEPIPVTSLEQVRDLLAQHITREQVDAPVAA